MTWRERGITHGTLRSSGTPRLESSVGAAAPPANGLSLVLKSRTLGMEIPVTPMKHILECSTIALAIFCPRIALPLCTRIKAVGRLFPLTLLLLWPDFACAQSSPPSIPPNSLDRHVFRVGGGVTSPTLLHKVEPKYTQEAYQARVQGTVLLYAQIDPNGHAVNIRVLHGLGLGLDENAIEAVRTWTFSPGMKGDEPVTVEAQIAVNFRLSNPRPGLPRCASRE